MLKILGHGSNKIGDAFVLLLKNLLDRLGYENILCNFRTTGREVDFTANHKLSNAPIIGEAKAWTDRSLGGPDVQKFLGSYELSYSKDSRLSGLFISLSGFKDDARKMIQEAGPSLQQRFRLLQSDDIEKALADSQLCISSQELQRMVAQKFSLPQGERFLTWSDHGLRWVQIFTTEERPSHFAIFNFNGNETPLWICEDLRHADSCFDGLDILDFEAEEKILLSLLKTTSLTLQQLLKETNLSEKQAKLCLASLSHSKILHSIQDKHTLKRDLNSYLVLARRFLNSDAEMIFLMSEYCQSGITEELMQHIQATLGFSFPPTEIIAIKELISVSSSVLKESLFGEREDFKTGKSQIKDKQLGEEAARKWAEVSYSRFLESLLQNFLFDMSENKNSELLQKKGVMVVRCVIALKLISLKGLNLESGVNADLILVRADGNLKIGELVSIKDPAAFIDLGLVYIQIGELDKAIEHFDRVISMGCTGKVLASAWNNKGLCLEKTSTPHEAISAFQEAIKADATALEPVTNLARIQKLSRPKDDGKNPL